MVKFAVPLLLMLSLAGCVSVVKDVVTAPIKVVSKTADLLTTSQSEADEKRGRNMRKQEETIGKLARKRDKGRSKCEDGKRSACDDVRELDEKIAIERNRPV